MRPFSYLIIAVFSVHACTPDSEPPLDLNELPPRQEFSIDPTRDTILLGEQGLRLFVPAHAFADENQDSLRATITIGLYEVLQPADRLLIGAVGAGKQGIARLEAWQGNRSLSLRKGVRLLLHFPVSNAAGEFVLRTGQVRSNGKIRWQAGKRAENYLIPVGFEQLAFHPKEFRAELNRLLPFGEFTEYDIALGDSLYFSFAGGEMLRLAPTSSYVRMNEAYYHEHHKFYAGSYTDDSYNPDALPDEHDSGYPWPRMAGECGIDPARIQALKAPELAGSLLATRAFAQRLQAILSIGDEALLDIYVNNLDRDLWMSDQAAADYLQAKETPRAAEFRRYAVSGLTNTKEGERYARLLDQVLTQRRRDFEQRLAASRARIAEALANEQEELETLQAEYRQLLWAREKHRMEYLTFEIGELGWYWPERKVIDPDTVFLTRLEVRAEAAERYEELYLYNVMPGAQSIYRLNTDDGEIFYAGNRREYGIYQVLHQPGRIVAIGYRGEQLFVGEVPYRVAEDNQLTVKLRRSTRRRLRETLGATIDHTRANDIRIDLPYVRALRAATYQRADLKNQQYTLFFLGAKAYPACNHEPTLAEAEQLFLTHCADCHSTDLTTDLTGPALLNVEAAYGKAWFTRFTEDSQWMIVEGDPRARELWRDWAPTVMPEFAETLTKAQIGAIYNYIESKK